MAKVKGAAIVGSVRILRGNKDKAREHLAPALHHYLSERVLAATWYPGEDMVPLLKAVATVLGEPEQGFYERAGRQSAQLHADGVYKHLVRAEGEEGFARRALVLWSSQHDTGRTDVRTDEQGRVHVS